MGYDTKYVKEPIIFAPVARIMGIDYGTKRTGIAVTDPLQIIASGLETVATSELFDWLAVYFETEEVERVVEVSHCIWMEIQHKLHI